MEQERPREGKDLEVVECGSELRTPSGWSDVTSGKSDMAKALGWTLRVVNFLVAWTRVIILMRVKF